MGRLAKYKKIKSFDPYSKKNGGNVDLSKVGVWGLGDNGQKVKKRSRRAELLRSSSHAKKKQKKSDEGFDLPPTEKDEFDLADLTGSVKNQELKNPFEETTEDSAYKIALKGNVATIPKTDADERKVARVLKLGTQAKAIIKKQTTESYARMEGESKRAYARRTKVETREIMKQTAEKNPEKRLKKKEFLNNKKKQKKGSGSFNQFSDRQESAADDDGDDDSSFITGERAVAAMADEVRFGEQAERPPVFRQLPRGAKAKEKPKAASKSKGMTDAQVAAETGAMEMMRLRVQAQYASIKAKRKRAGDFHL
jgi:hypothetical protein